MPEGQELNSRVLATIGEKAEADPFDKVKKMIKDLKEANEEVEYKGWCDIELPTKELNRKEKTEAIETLYVETDQIKASIAKSGRGVQDVAGLLAGEVVQDLGQTPSGTPSPTWSSRTWTTTTCTLSTRGKGPEQQL